MRKTFIWLLAAVVIILLLAAGGWWFKNKGQKGGLLGAAEALAQDGVILEVVKGQVKISFEGEEKTLTSPVAQEVEPGVIVITLAGSQANLVFPNGSLARLDEETSVNLTEFFSEAQSSGVKLELNSGNLWSRVQRLLDKETNYEVQTANAVAVVKGTIFNMVYKEGKTKLEVLSNKVAIKAIDPQTKQTLAGGEAEVETGNSVEMDTKEPPTAQKPLVIKILSAADLDRPWFKDNLAKDKQVEEKIRQASGGSGEVRQQDLREKVLPAMMTLEKKDFSDKPIFEKFIELKEIRQEKIENRIKALEQAQDKQSPSVSSETNLSSIVTTASPKPLIKTPLVSQPPEVKLSVASIDPDVTYGPGYQYTKVTINGSGFGPLAKGSIGGLALTSVKVLNANTLEAMVSPNLQPGVYDVILTSGLQRVVLSKGFEVLEVE